MEMNSGKIYIVGCGPGSVDYVTPAACAAVEEAQVLIGAGRLLELFPDSPARTIGFDSDTRLLLTELQVLLKQGQNVAVLVSGDPGSFSLARPIVQKFGVDVCKIIPGVSSIQVAFARVGLDWTDAKIFSAHARTPQLSADELRSAEKIAILAGTPAALELIAALAGKLEQTHELVLCENLTLPDERVRTVKPSQLVAGGASSLAIALLVQRTLLS